MQYLVHYDVCIMHLMQGKTQNQGFWSAPYLSGLKFLNGGVRGSQKIATAAEMLIISMVALALKKKSRYIGAPSHLLSVIIYFSYNNKGPVLSPW